MELVMGGGWGRALIDEGGEKGGKRERGGRGGVYIMGWVLFGKMDGSGL
jgi:hypothetical protein